MIAAALQLFTFARGLSAKTWLVVITLVAILAAGVRLVNYGEHREASRVSTIARADTINTELATLHVAQAKQDTALTRLTAARTATIATTAARTSARNAVIPSPASDPSEATNLYRVPLDSLPPALITLINADDAKIAADSVYIMASDSVRASIEPVENAHAALDTTLSHPLDLTTHQTLTPSRGWYAVAGILVGGARLCYNLARHRPVLP